ncbi:MULTISPECIES: hypothetical protein [unclassified Streptomyces]
MPGAAKSQVAKIGRKTQGKKTGLESAMETLSAAGVVGGAV